MIRNLFVPCSGFLLNQKKKVYSPILILLFSFLIVSCESTDSIVPSDFQKSLEVKDSILNSLNSDEIIFEGSEDYYYLKEETKFNYYLAVDEDYRHLGGRDFSDSIEVLKNSDSVCLNYYFPIVGTDEIIPFIQYENKDSVVINTYQVGFCEIEFIDEKYEIRYMSMALENIFRLRLAIPKKFIDNRVLIFKGRSISI